MSASALAKTTLRAEGFSCPSCVTKIEKQVGAISGVDAVKVYFNTSRIVVDHDPRVVKVEDLEAAIEKAGYTAKASAF